MEREMRLMIGVDNDGWPYIKMVDVQSGKTMMVSGVGSRNYPAALSKLAKGLWDEVHDVISEIQD